MLSSRYMTMQYGAEKHLIFAGVLTDFLTLIEGIPFSRILKCKGCDRWFISTYVGKERRKDYCNRNCASRSNKRDLRTNPARKEEWEKVKLKQKEEYKKRA
jgi:hypothetical protein